MKRTLALLLLLAATAGAQTITPPHTPWTYDPDAALRVWHLTWRETMPETLVELRIRTGIGVRTPAGEERWTLDSIRGRYTAREILLTRRTRTPDPARWLWTVQRDTPRTVQSWTYRITIDTPGTNIQLYRRGFTLQPGKGYAVRIRGRAERPETLLVSVHRHTAPYTNYGLNNRQLFLGPREQEQLLAFIAGAGTLTDPRIRLTATGKARPGTRYELGWISIERTDTTSVLFGRVDSAGTGWTWINTGGRGTTGPASREALVWTDTLGRTRDSTSALGKWLRPSYTGPGTEWFWREDTLQGRVRFERVAGSATRNQGRDQRALLRIQTWRAVPDSIAGRL